jgi:D-glycero-alpha-D-manno-heptose-7-phosphate kinase
LEACHVEQNLINENVGSQDQFHSAFGGFNIIEFEKENINVRPIIISSDRLRKLNDHLIIFYTGLTRFATEVVKEQIDKTLTKSNDEYLKKMLDMVYEAENILSDSSEYEFIKNFGNLLHESWVLKKKLSSKISNSQIDESYEIAMKNGAWGGKLCGAGSGGFLAFFAPRENHDNIRKALKNLLEVNFKFENQGSTIIYMKD